jgi:hypothetical protein
MNHYDFIGVLWIVLSIGLFYVTFWMLSTGILESELYSVMGQLATFENQYFLLFFFTTAYILIEYGVKILDAEINNGIQEFKHNQKVELQQEIKVARENRGRKVTVYKRKYLILNLFNELFFL